MRVTVLGSGQDGGLPQFGADHPNDSNARSGMLPERSASSVLVEVQRASVLLDIGPDARTQWWGRIGAPDAIAITHAHMGHYTGLVHLGRESMSAGGVRCHMARSMLSFLEGNQPWRQLIDLGSIRPELSNPYRCERYTIRLIPVRSTPTPSPYRSTAGLSTFPTSMAGMSGRSPSPSSRATRSLCSTPRSGRPTSYRLGSRTSPNPPVVETIERFARLDTAIALTHISFVDPTSEASRAVSDLGWAIARDGLVIDLPER